MSKFKRFVLGTTALLTMAVMQAAPLSVSRQNPSVGENFDSMWDQATQTASLTLPDGWMIDRNLTAPRTVGAWSDASNTVMYEGGISLASNASNGTWNFRDSEDASDRAIGGLTTTVANGTRCVSLMTSIKNEDTDAIKALSISYNIEKYRKGDNAAGFEVQMYFSTNGIEWVKAGDDFRTFFEPDNETLGSAVVPISATPVAAKTLLADVMPGSEIYLAWNISVASGSSPNKAPGLALDDISISAQFADANTHSLYIENAIGKSGLKIYATDSDFYGAAPGQASTMTKILNGVRYSAWDMPSANFELMVTVGDNIYGPVMVDASADAYYCVTKTGLDEIAFPDSYTGWIDPDRKPFVASGYYLRGEVNSWNADSNWEFSNEGDGIYVLYDKELSGAFKVADANWSSAFNYGSNGTNVFADELYQLKLGTDDNISTGNSTFICKRIVLTLTDEGACLVLESDDNEDGLTTVYMVGDFNGWDYNSKAGALTLDSDDNLFKGRVSMKAGADGLSHWRIYQRLSMAGVWGLPADATSSTVAGSLQKGMKYNAAVAPATYDVAFSLTDGAYTLTKVESTPTNMSLSPAQVVLTPENPASVKVLSLNNSLIHYNDQDFVFNDIARAMGADAAWTKHTNLGKPLSYHWEEGDGLAADGTPGAKMMIRSEAWSHIILQEQSSLPRTNPETFRANVEQWIGYIREYCPNPNAVIILPVNWAYSGDWGNFNSYNARFLEVYTDVAAEYGAVVVPVALAYDNIYTQEGSEVTSQMFSDDRHPTPKATYMAACMEYAAILGVDPSEITYTPIELTEAEGKAMRRYASEAHQSFSNIVDHLNGKVNFQVSLVDDFGMEFAADGVEYSVNGGGTISPEGQFVSDGTHGEFTVTAKYGQFEKQATVKVTDHSTEVVDYPAIILNADQLEASEDFNSMGDAADATLPEAWRVDRQTVGPRIVGTYATALDKTSNTGGVSLPSNAKNGIWNFGDNAGTDRAVGGITTGVADGARGINLYTHLRNNGSKKLVDVQVSYDVEQYRKGNNAAGFAVQMYYSYDGRNWVSAGTDFYTYIEPATATEGFAQVPGAVFPVEAQLPIDLPAGVEIFLAWNISVASGDVCQGAPALAIDNFAVTASLPVIPACNHYIYVDNQTSWTALGLYAYGDSELFGAWPGQAPLGEKEIDGTNYHVFGFDADGGYNLIFNNWNNNKQLPDHFINVENGDGDRYFRIDDEKVTPLATPTSVSNVTVTKSELIYDGTILYNMSGSELHIYNLSGNLIMITREPEVDMGLFSPGIYVATSTDSVLKIARR